MKELLSSRYRARSDEDFIKRHLKKCNDCALENMAFDELYEDSFTPPHQLDDLSRRRYVSDVLAGQEESLDKRDSVKKSRIPIWLPVAASFAAAAAVIIFMIGSDKQDDAKDGPEVTSKTEAPSSGSIDAKILLSSEKRSILTAGSKVELGQTITSKMGNLAIGITDGITALLGPNSQAKLENADNENIRVRLLNGSLVSFVHPNNKGQNYTVVTERSEIVVAGTVFAVQAQNEVDSVRVLRGKVKVHRDGKLYAALASNQVAKGPDWIARAATDTEKKDMQLSLGVLELLTAQKMVWMDINSSPEGAVVELNGIPIGKTPFLAQVRVGHSELAINLDGYQTIVEQLNPGLGTRIERTFKLVKSDENPKREVATKRSEGPADLLSRAQELKMAKEWEKAASAYGNLISSFPKSGAAKSALVSLGKLELNKLGRPNMALKRFDQYLKGGGTLSQEAMYGKAAALRKMGLKQQEKETLTRFVELFPNSVEYQSAARRLKELN